jgi:hypothetical protein
MAPDRSKPGRSCGGCVACCDGSLRIKVFEHEVYPGKPCPFCTGSGCSIHGRHPVDPCQRFVCGWLAPTSPLPEWMRPDKAGLVLLPAQFTWRGLRVDVAVPTGGGPKAKALQWLKEFSRQQQRPLVYHQGEDCYAFGPDEFQQEIKRKLARGEALWA